MACSRRFGDAVSRRVAVGFCGGELVRAPRGERAHGGERAQGGERSRASRGCELWRREPWRREPGHGGFAAWCRALGGPSGGGVTVAHGYLAMVLHAHLPFVRHPEAPSYMEEEWFFEAITETYIPLLLAFERLARDDVDFRITMSFSPSLLSMMTDDLLKERYARKLDTLIELSEKEVDRTWREDRTFHELAKMYRHRIDEIRDCWRRYDGDLIRGFRALQDAGHLEIIICTATHPFFPLLDRNWAAFRAQIHAATHLYERLFGRRSQGMWLGECGYVPGVDELMREEGIRFFFVDTHGMLFADPRPLYGVHAPVYCRSGVAAFGRDIESSKQVWSAEEGYPGDPVYRDFYRDIGFDLPFDYISPYIHPAGIRTFTGTQDQAANPRSVDKQ